MDREGLSMADLIDRSETQTELMMKRERYTLARESHGFGRVEWSGEVISLSDAMDVIRYMPTAEPQWIPCDERLPEKDDYKSCIECLDGAVWYFTENGTMGLGYYYKSTKEWSTTDDLKTDGKVIAWMPLPKPYKEGD